MGWLRHWSAGRVTGVSLLWLLASLGGIIAYLWHLGDRALRAHPPPPGVQNYGVTFPTPPLSLFLGIALGPIAALVAAWWWSRSRPAP